MCARKFRFSRYFHRATLAVLMASCSAAALAVTLLQKDEFEAGALHGWEKGLPISAITNPGGYLEYASSGNSGPGSRMVVLNEAQWTGNYVTAGVDAIKLDARNAGSTTLRLRVVVRDAASGDDGGTAYVSATPLVLNAGSGWVTHTFLFSDLVLASDSAGSATKTQVLQNVQQVRIISATQTNFRGDQIAATLNLDNIQAEAEGGPGGVVPDVVKLLTLPNAGGTAAPEAVVLTKVTAPVAGEGFVKDYGNAASLGTFGTTAGPEPKDAAVVPDRDGNNVDDIAVLLDDQLANRPRVEIRDPLTGKKLRNINYNTDHEAVALAIIADQNGNQTPEGVVLSRRGGDRPRLLIRDLGTGDVLPTVSLPRTVRPLGLVMADDFSGNGAPEALVLVERKSNDRGYVFVWDIGGAGKVATVRLPGGNTPLSHTVFSGPGGVTAVAVLAQRVSDDRGKLFVFDAFTGASLWGASLVDGREPVAVRAYVPASGGPRLAVLQEQLSDKTPIVTVFQGDTGAVVTNVVYGSGQTPVALEVIPDLALDSGSEPEFSVLIKDDALRVRVRDSVSRALIQTLPIP